MSEHLGNLETKIKSNYKGLQPKLIEFKNDNFLPFNAAISSISFDDEDFESFKQAAILIEDYMDKVDEFCIAEGITSQSKFASSLIEDIPMYLLKNITDQVEQNIGIYNKGIFAGLHILSDYSLNVSTKDVDFCIGINKIVTLDGNDINIVIPFICIEVKTYLDGTMIYEVQFSSDKLKRASSGVKTYVIMKYNQVGAERLKDAKANNILDEMFVIGYKDTNKIDARVIQEIYKTIKADIISIGTEIGSTQVGRLLNE